MNTATSITIDLSYLHMVTGGDRVFEKKILQTAVDDIQKKVENLQVAWLAKDIPTIRSNAHSLKSLTAIAGIPQIENWSKTVDNMLATGTLHSSSSIPVNGIIDGWGIAKTKLQEVLSAY